jgi:hypothetical protein
MMREGEGRRLSGLFRGPYPRPKLTLQRYTPIFFVMDPDALLLNFLATAEGSIDSYRFAESAGVAHGVIVGAAKSLEAEGYVVCEANSSEAFVLTAEALSYVAEGSPEVQLFRALPAEGLTEAELLARFSNDFVAIAKGKALKFKWITRDPASGLYRRSVLDVGRDVLVEELLSVRDGKVADDKLIKDLQKRKLIEKRHVSVFRAQWQLAGRPLQSLLFAASAPPSLCLGVPRSHPFDRSNPLILRRR